MRRRFGRRVAATAMFTTGLLGLVGSLATAQDNAPRTESDLLGYDLETEASPISVLFYEDFIPLPTPPGEAQFEMTLSYTLAELTSGPSSRATASSVWPGPGLGDGWGTVVCAFQGEDCDDSQSYPIGAFARYPGNSEEDWEGSTTFPAVEDFGMHASARGLDVVARSEGGGFPSAMDALVTVGNIRSESTNTVRDGQAVARSVSEISEIALLEGVVVLEGVTTTLEVVSDGETATTDGTTTIGGVEILGMPARLTDEGFVVEPEDDGGEDDDGDEDDGPGLPGADDLGDAVLTPINELLNDLTSDLVADGFEEALGIEIEALDQTQTVDGAIGTRTAQGVRVRVDVETLAAYLDPIADLVPLNDVIEGVPTDQLPEDLQQVTGLLLELQGIRPGIEFVLGRGSTTASASPPFEMPDLPPPPAPPVSGGTTSAPTTSTPPSTGSSGGVSVPPPTSSGPAPSTPPATQVAPPQSPAPSGPVAVATEPPDPYPGISGVLIGFALMLGAVPTWGLRTLRERAVGATSAEAPSTLPDLRAGG